MIETFVLPDGVTAALGDVAVVAPWLPVTADAGGAVYGDEVPGPIVATRRDCDRQEIDVDLPDSLSRGARFLRVVHQAPAVAMPSPAIRSAPVRFRFLRGRRAL